MDEDTLLRRLDTWSKNLVEIATLVCPEEHAPKGVAKDARPCRFCMRVVSQVTRYWFNGLLVAMRAARARAKVQGVELPTVDLATAFFLGTSVLDPATSVELEGWGPA